MRLPVAVRVASVVMSPGNCCVHNLGAMEGESGERRNEGGGFPRGKEKVQGSLWRRTAWVVS